MGIAFRVAMARPGKYDKDKPEAIRMIREGFAWGDLKARFKGIPDATLHGWFKQFGGTSETSESPSEPPRPRLPIDPESPLEKIKHALWDIVYEPQGKGAAVQALNILLKIEAPWLASGTAEPAGDDTLKEIAITRQIVDASNP
jgi:hypothetical protein